MMKYAKTLLPIVIASLAVCGSAFAQPPRVRISEAIPPRIIDHDRQARRLPPPVRLVDHRTLPTADDQPDGQLAVVHVDTLAIDDSMVDSHIFRATPPPAHRTLAPPPEPTPATIHDQAAATVDRWTRDWQADHPPLLKSRDPASAATAKLPAGQTGTPVPAVRPMWKTPYAYGHFGASARRHWTRQHGYRDRQTIWTRR